ncbi:MAG: alanine/glycine:cation symporter family protein [Zetaproteobacteria bacterium]|nr:alanine/glycine:cation symporter family protein [Zetaproteobacteria bacterium]
MSRGKSPVFGTQGTPVPFVWLLLTLGWSPSIHAAVWEQKINSFFGQINQSWGGILFWSDHPLQLPLILIVMIFGGLFFTFKYGFINVRLFKHAFDVIRGKFDKKHNAGEITHFQALTSALSATVGIGNIGGVAIAVSLGGPGVVFWLWVVAFFGMSMKFSSCTLAQYYRDVDTKGNVLGGPMVYLAKGFSEKHVSMRIFGKGLSIIFAVFTIVASFGGGNLFQGNQTFEVIQSQFPSTANYGWLVGLILAICIGAVIIGGIKRIGEVTGKMVPAMCVLYCGCCITIIASNSSHLGSTIYSIFTEAFQPDALWAGGFMGVLIQGMRRASFSNEAGIGSASIAHAAAKTDQPVREGVVSMIGPFIDTHIVCTMTALTILTTGAHLDPLLTGKGAAITAKAFGQSGSMMPLFLMLAAIIFAYSTAVSWYYYGEKAVQFLFGMRHILTYRIVYVSIAALGPILELGQVIDFSDIMLLSMAFPNIIGMVFLSGQVKALIGPYMKLIAKEQHTMHAHKLKQTPAKG